MRLSEKELRDLQPGAKLWLFEDGSQFQAIFKLKRDKNSILLHVDQGEKHPDPLPWSLIRNAPVSDEGPLANQRYSLEYRDA